MKRSLIIGGGFAGIAMAWELEKRNIPYAIADPFTQNSSTFISAGLINPVSGRKYQLQWNIEYLLSFIEREMKQLESFIQAKILFRSDILKIHKSEEALEAWQLQKEKFISGAYISGPTDIAPLSRYIDARFGAITIHQALRIDTKTYIEHYLSAIGDKWIETHVDHAEINITENEILFQNESYERIIFCEGVAALKNPWFSYIPFKPAKGECMIIRIPHFNYDQMIHKGIILIPLGNYLWWAGATNTWNDMSVQPTENGIKELRDELNSLLKVSYDIVEMQAAIRPTIKDRTPVAGVHPNYKNVFILNGLGTKGASLSNFYASRLAGYIFDGAALPEAANVARFDHLAMQ